MKELVSQKAEPRNRSEQEIAGYREVLSTIHEGYEYINPKSNIILQLHRDLYSYSQGAAGGSYKNSDNVIAEIDVEGHQKARFIPVPAFQPWRNRRLRRCGRFGDRLSVPILTYCSKCGVCEL